MGIPLLGAVPSDPAINNLDILGDPIVALSDDSSAYQAIVEMLAKILSA